MAKLSISVPDELVDDLRDFGTTNMSAFVTTAIRHELDRRRLSAFVDELDDELGPADEDEVAAFMELFTETAVASASGRRNASTPPRRAGARPRP
jgi:post-segregation antitoxin (ccd killing protein)